MALTYFFLRPGELHGRISPTGWIAPSGEKVLGLGSDRPGLFERLNTGDMVEWTNNVQLAGAQYVRARVAIRPPADMPAGTAWQLSMRIDGQYSVWTTRISRERDLFDIALNTGGFAGAFHTIGVRLQLLGTSGPLTDVEVELPAVYVDAFVIIPTGAPRLANRDPEPDETGIPVTTNITIDLHNPGASTKVYVDGVLAFDDSVGFSMGFDGPSSQVVGIPGGGSARVVIDPTTSFASEQVVSVHVVSGPSGPGIPVIDETYSFTIADVATPEVAAAMGIDVRRVRVAFSEPVQMLDALSPADALNPANYVFTAKTAPAAPIAAAAVEAFSATAVDVTLNTESTFGAVYEVAVSNVADISGNVVAPPTNVADFVAYSAPVPAARRWGLWRFIPQKNKSEDGSGDLRRFVSCLDEVNDQALARIDAWTSILDPDTAAEPFVDLMLWGLGNPFPFTLSLIDKRRLLRVLVSIYKLKGTAPGIINVVRFFVGVQPDITITSVSGEGWDLGEAELGEDTVLGPSESYNVYSFEIHSEVLLTDEQRERISIIANYMKPAHTHLVRIAEPEPPPPVIDHLELGESELGVSWELH